MKKMQTQMAPDLSFATMGMASACSAVYNAAYAAAFVAYARNPTNAKLHNHWYANLADQMACRAVDAYRFSMGQDR